MLKSLSIENFRRFEKFELAPLGRINLLVGKNNSGKTSILEAIHLIRAGQNLKPFQDMMLRRGEYSFSDQDSEKIVLESRNLFYGYKVSTERSILLRSLMNDDRQLDLEIKFENIHSFSELPPQMLKNVLTLVGSVINERGNLSQKIDMDELLETDKPFASWMASKIDEFDWFEKIQMPFSLRIKSNALTQIDSLNKNRQLSPLLSSASGQVSLQDFPRVDINHNDTSQVLFISPLLYQIPEFINYFDKIILGPEEETIHNALRVISPDIERIAVTSVGGAPRNFFAKLSGIPQRVALGSLGDGVRYLLGLVLALVQVPNGILLVDDIDTGLHYSTLSKMWQLVWETAKKLNIQVFATTHNNDCWQSLAEITTRDDVADEDITIHRIEQGLTKSVEFTAPEIQMAVDRELEVR